MFMVCGTTSGRYCTDLDAYILLGVSEYSDAEQVQILCDS